MTGVEREPRVLEDIVWQHVQEAAALWWQRTFNVKAPHLSLRQLAWHDERLAAHLDGLSVADEAGIRACEQQLADEGAGEMFCAAVLALQAGAKARLASLFALAETVIAMRQGLAAAFGWISPDLLVGTVRDLLASDAPLAFLTGVTCCAMHRVDPGVSLERAARNDESLVRARAMRTIGELGQAHRLRLLQAAMNDGDVVCRFWAAKSALLVGERGRSIDVLAGFSLVPGDSRAEAMAAALQALEPAEGHALLQRIARTEGGDRLLIRGSGIAGDPRYAEWLLQQMRAPLSARRAGESFALITGLDLSQGFDASRPDGIESGPNDDPADSDVSMDPDDGLPWPDADKISRWWGDNQQRFATGRRYFMGAPVTREHCLNVLKTASQRQRIFAAHYLCLLDPGTPLFNTSAPAWRQQRLLAQMT